MICSALVVLSTLCVVIVNIIALKVVNRRMRSIKPPTYDEVCAHVPGFEEEVSEEDYNAIVSGGKR